jgi:hypothetical protein
MENNKKPKYLARIKYHSNMLLAGVPLLQQELEWLKYDKNIRQCEIEKIENDLLYYKFLLNKYFEN